MYGNIVFATLAMFPFRYIAAKKPDFFLNGKILNGYAIRANYSKYWNLLVEKANVTTKPSLGSDDAVTSMPILEHRRATR
mgnify:FL=1